MENNTNKYALVTGGTSGIGYELAKDGYNLIITARTENDLERVSEELRSTYGIQVLTISKDLFDRNNAFDLYTFTKSRNVEIDVLVNDVGHGHYGEFIDTDLDMELKIIDLNIASLVIL